MRALLLVALFTVPGCGGAPGMGPTPPASQGIQSFIDSLRSDDPAAAYALLADELKASISFEEFAIQWRESARERADQARSLEEGLKGSPGLGERAKIIYRDGKAVHVLREGGRWTVESAMVSRIHAGRPEDAVEIFAEALARRDYNRVLRILTTRRRDGISDQVDRFVTSLLEQLAGAENTIETINEDRAEIRWDGDGRRYKIVLRKENDEWRIDDVYLRPVPTKADSE